MTDRTIRVQLPASKPVTWWPWRRKAPVPRYLDAVELIDWASRYAYEPLLDEKQRRAYRHMLDQIGRMDWQQ